METNFDKFMAMINVIRAHSHTFIGFTTEARENRPLYQSFLEKLIENDLVEPSKQGIWNVRAKQALIEMTDKDLKNLFEGKEESKSFKEGFREFKKSYWGEMGKYAAKATLLVIGFLIVLLGWDKCSTQKKERQDSTQKHTQQVALQK